ncbi:alpha-(1,3)-fucosyltransferase, partial [Helicobacter pylori]|nr:alpha-(1,3)-fucosyltransferase [Helicobacter pylori]
MFQPLLDAFIESAPIKKKLPLNLPPLKIAVANWWGGAEEFKKSALYFILSQRYKITLHQNPNELSDLVFGSPIGSARKILSYQNTKRVFYTGENEAPNFNLFDYA